MITITLNDDSIEIIEVDNFGRKTVKNCKPNSLIKLLESCRPEKEVKFASGLLPRNCLEVKQSKSKKTAVLFVEEGEFELKYYDSKYKVFIPSILFAITISNEGRIQSSHIAITKESDIRKISDDTTLYCYPFGNTNNVSMSVCWGSTKRPTIKNLKQLQGIPFLFLASELNNDWYQGSNTSKLEFRELLIALEKKELDIMSILKPANLNYRQFVDKI